MFAGSFLNLIAQGGMVIYPLIACSMVAVTVTIERAWSLRKAGHQTQRLHHLVDESLSENHLADAIALCRHDSAPLAEVYRAILNNLTAEEGTRDRLAQSALSKATRRIKRYLWLLGTIGSLAPFIGLFGTVVGIIRAFDDMAATGSGGFAVVAAGISEALIATAGGLLVGVLSIFAYNAFMVRSQHLGAEFRENADELLGRLSNMPHQPVREGTVTRVIQSG